MSVTKVAKNILFTAQAHESHTSLKVKNVLRWLKSGHEVRVRISGKADRQRAMESIVSQLEKDTRAGARLLQKVVKPESIKFVLVPTEKASEIHVPGDLKTTIDIEKEIDDITADKDIFSADFEEELIASIRKDKSTKK